MFPYMDSEMLNTCQTGCYSGVSNHLMYADDLALLSPSKICLSRLLNAVMIMLSHMILYTMDLRVVCQYFT